MITEAGLVQHWLNEEIGHVPQCLRPPSADRSQGIAALNLDSFGGPLLVLVAGERTRKFVWKGKLTGRLIRNYDIEHSKRL